jgi:hypothetical protein
MVILAQLIGYTAGSLFDPFVVTMLILIFALALNNAIRPWVPALIALVTNALHVAVVYSWWQEAGMIANWEERALWMLAAKLVLVYVAYAAGRLISRAGKHRSPETSAPTPKP